MDDANERRAASLDAAMRADWATRFDFALLPPVRRGLTE
jgi:hypothetical protein